jgi:glycosyltransferase involved in cell wall biosynthesis
MNEILNNTLNGNRSDFNRQHQNTTLLRKILYNDKLDVTYSVIIPVYNQGDIIVTNISSILNNIGGVFEIIIILDLCKDNSKQNIINFFDTYKNTNPNFYGVTIYSEDKIPLFEATCDNIGFIFSKGKYCLEIQADMEMTEKNFNIHLHKPFNMFPNIIAVSGRCAHNFFDSGGMGKLGTDIEKNLSQLNIKKNYFYTYETCNRGPLLLDRSKLQELQYLDEKNWYLDNSDHDLMYRAFDKMGYICGYVPIDFNSPLNLGTTRKRVKPDNINEQVRRIRINESIYNCDFQQLKDKKYIKRNNQTIDLI